MSVVYVNLLQEWLISTAKRKPSFLHIFNYFRKIKSWLQNKGSGETAAFVASELDRPTIIRWATSINPSYPGFSESHPISCQSFTQLLSLITWKLPITHPIMKNHSFNPPKFRGKKSILTWAILLRNTFKKISSITPGECSFREDFNSTASTYSNNFLTLN